MSEADLQRLTQKLKAGRNEAAHGFDKYMTAKFYKNLTQSQYQGALAPQNTLKAAARDSLNPVANLNRMKQRLAATEAIAARYSPQQLNWVKFALEKAGKKVWTYKFNYLVKAVFLFRFYAEIRHYNHMNKTSILPDDPSLFYPMIVTGGLAAGVCALI